MKVILYTNATLLSEDMSRALIDAGLTRMVFSVDAGDPITYAKLRPGLDWETVVRNTKTFCNLARRMGTRVSTQARITMTPENDGPVGHITQFWRRKGIDHVRCVSEVYIPPLDFHPLWSSEQEWIDCRAPHQHFVVRANLDVVPCCRDYWGHYKMGNIEKGQPREIWKTDAWQTLRASFLEGQDYPHLCDLCKAPHERHNA